MDLADSFISMMVKVHLKPKIQVWRISVTVHLVVKILDINGDGAMDILQVRVVPFLYGVNPNSFILINDGQGNFTDGTAQYAPELKKSVW